MDSGRLDSEWTREAAQAAVARYNLLFPLEENGGWQRVVAEAKERQVAVSLQMSQLDDTALTGGDILPVAMRILFLHAKWLREEETIRLLQTAKRDNEEAARFLKSLEAQEKER